MKTILFRRRGPVWNCLLSGLCLGGALSAPAATLSDFGYTNMASGASRPMLVILANFPAPSDPVTNIVYYSNRVFGTTPGQWTANSYFKEVSNDRFQWTPTRVLRVDMPESDRYVHFNNANNYASNIIYRAVATNGFNWDVYGQPGSTNVTARDLAISLFSNDGGHSARGVWDVKPPGVTRSYAGLVYVGEPQASLDIDCHEMAHLLGALDFYGIWGISECLAEKLSLMSCSDGLRKHLDAWHKMQFGWSEPRIFSLNSGGTATLNAAQLGSSTAPVILYDPNRGPSEFFLLEYRTKTVTNFGGGFDAGVYGNGLVIWHVFHEANKKPKVMAEISWPDAERLWRECTKCRALTYGTTALGVCAAGGVHAPFVDDHGLVKNDPSASGQPDWKICTKCKALFYGPNQATSNCQAGGTHLADTNKYTLITDTTVLANPYWYRCTQCETLVREWYNFYAPWTSNSVCVAGGRHTPDTSVMYKLPAFWGIKSLQPEAYPDLRRGESAVWAGGSSTPWLWWYDQTTPCVNVQVQPFVNGQNAITIDWTNESGPWVDFYYTGTEFGSFTRPFNRVIEGVNAVSTESYHLYIKQGWTTEAAHITKRMRIRSYGGDVYIGRRP